MNRRQFLTGSVAAAALSVFPISAEAAPVTVVTFNPTVDQMKAAAKSTATGEATSAGTTAATDVATNEVTKRLGALGGWALKGVDKVKEAGSTALGTITNETGKGAQILLTQAITDGLKKGPVVVMFGVEEQSASLKTALAASAKPVVLIVADGTKGKELGEALAAITKDHAALGTPLAQFYKADATRTDATFNAFQVNADTVKNILGGGAAAPATRPPTPASERPPAPLR